MQVITEIPTVVIEYLARRLRNGKAPVSNLAPRYHLPYLKAFVIRCFSRSLKAKSVTVYQNEPLRIYPPTVPIRYSLILQSFDSK